MADTSIEWTDKVWNPTTGCDRVSPGCDHCYALTMAARLKGMGSTKYQQDGDPRTSGPGFLAVEHESDLGAPLRWTKPAKVFVNSMSDLFHDRISDEFIARVFGVMAMAQRHTFQVLTKRHARMRSLLNSAAFLALVAAEVSAGDGEVYRRKLAGWPLPNVWLGVSVENQQWADIRIPALLDTPAAVRWLSCEPLLGPVDLTRTAALGGNVLTDLGVPGTTKVDWVVAGGESGPGARPMHPAWARSLRDQCTAADVPFHFKQWGAWSPRNEPWRSPAIGGLRAVWMTEAGATKPWGELTGAEDEAQTAMYRVGKKAAGRELDGRTWDEYPEVSAGARTDEGRARSGGPSEPETSR